jgi:hypothetical protein
MKKWILPVLVGASAYWFFAARSTVAVQPTEAQCKSLGGQMVKGMGCVMYDGDMSKLNADVPAEQVKAICKKEGMHYDPARNTCLSFK